MGSRSETFGRSVIDSDEQVEIEAHDGVSTGRQGFAEGEHESLGRGMDDGEGFASSAFAG